MNIKKILPCLALVILIAVCGLFLFPKEINSRLINQIKTAERENKKLSENDLSLLANQYIQIGMSYDQVVTKFKDMGFDIHPSWKDKDVIVADYRHHLGPSFLNIVKTYRFVFHFESGILKSFVGQVYTNAP